MCVEGVGYMCVYVVYAYAISVWCVYVVYGILYSQEFSQDHSSEASILSVTMVLVN